MPQYTDKDLARLSSHIEATGTPAGFKPEPRKKRDNAESRLQQECVKWWTANASRFGVDHRLLYAVPNGAMYGTGVSKLIRAKILKLEGLRNGWPDLGLDVARGRFHGMRIEMKLPTTNTSPDQDAIHALLKEQGYCVGVTRTFMEFTASVEAYLSIK